jgi:hypothetical protein
MREFKSSRILLCGGVLNTSTVALKVIGGDDKGNLESEKVKYGRESHGTRTRK